MGEAHTWRPGIAHAKPLLSKTPRRSAFGVQLRERSIDGRTNWSQNRGAKLQIEQLYPNGRSPTFAKPVADFADLKRFFESERASPGEGSSAAASEHVGHRLRSSARRRQQRIRAAPEVMSSSHLCLGSPCIRRECSASYIWIAVKRPLKSQAMSRPTLITLLLLVVAAFAAAAPALTAPSFDEVMRPCMASEAMQPAVQRASTCLCYVEELRRWSANAALLLTRQPGRDLSRRAALNQCRAEGARLN